MKIGHQMILASAGSGKTYALTNRFVRLLALGAKPERIVALTFTRKAAGEFFDAILHKLAAAATNPKAAAQLARDIEMPAIGSAEFLTMLRAVVDAMHRLRLGTLDGFFAGIAKSFPFELGLSGAFEVMEEHAAQQAQRRVLQEIFASSGRLSEAQQEFIEAFKLATFGREEKRLADKLATFLRDHQQTYLDAPNGEWWGNAARIWPEGCDWPLDESDLAEVTTALRTAASEGDWDDRRQVWWEKLFAALETWTPGVEMGTELQNVLKALPDMAVVTMDRKKVEPAPALRDALIAVARTVVGLELTRRLAMTRGLYAVIGGYEEIYNRTIRRAGRLTFADVQRLLLPDGEGGRALSTDSAGDGRLLIDYRLDAEIDHWLLDEFQDTSFGQWSVLKNLIDETVQDPEGRRSFFYVGDVKQAIYAWREGDPRLFREIFNHYNDTAPGTIEEAHLDLSWRSGPPVIDMVNTVFGAAAVLADLFPAASAEAWNREWREHQSARPQLGGQAALLLAENREERFGVTLKLLREMPKPRPDFSVAVLVQKNDTAAELADYLRREGGIAAVAEADLHVCIDNPVGVALLALTKAAAHPGDTLAWEHVRMSPLGAVLSEVDITTPEALTWRLLGRFASEGFEATLSEWWRLLAKWIGPDAFTWQRARQFLAAAAEFDAGGSREAAEFVDFMTRYTLREPDSAAVVRVMTIHKSKGLGFDAVILPDLKGDKLAQARDGLGVCREEDHTVRWVMSLPRKNIAGLDAELTDYVESAEASACYEKLSLLYVAMTRAKRALYVVVEPPKKSSTSHNFTKLLVDTLGGETGVTRIGRLELASAWAKGDPDWMDGIEFAEEHDAEPPRPLLDVAKVRKSRRLIARRPSDDTGTTKSAAALFALNDTSEAMAFGRAVHGLFAQVEWIENEVPEELARSLAGQGVAGAEVLACLQEPALAEVWRRADGATLWRERAFEAVIDGTWVTGVFDRVVVQCDAAGRVQQARIYDFKTDAIGDEAVERHGRQLNLYRGAAAQLLGLAPAAVSCAVVMTKARQCIEVPAE